MYQYFGVLLSRCLGVGLVFCCCGTYFVSVSRYVGTSLFQYFGVLVLFYFGVYSFDILVCCSLSTLVFYNSSIFSHLYILLFCHSVFIYIGSLTYFYSSFR